MRIICKNRQRATQKDLLCIHCKRAYLSEGGAGYHDKSGGENRSKDTATLCHDHTVLDVKPNWILGSTQPPLKESENYVTEKVNGV